MLYGILNLSLWGYIAALLIMTHITVMSVTLYLHRCQAHRGLELHPIVSHFCRFWLWLTTGMETKKWVAIHRKHHARCETEDDPHSPQILGLKKVLLEGAELYRAEGKKQETLDRYGDGTPEDWLERNVYERHTSRGVVLMLLIDLLLFGIPGVSIWALQMMWIPFFAAGIINGVGHYFGYRNFECPDAATNVMPIGLIMGGEELHNNHHTYGTSAKLSVKWWEFDIGWLYIRVLQVFGLAKPKRMVPKVASNPSKKAIDRDTISAVITNRFQVMSRYSKDVLAPMIKQEKAKAGDAGRTMLKRAKTLLSRDPSLVSEAGKQRIANIVASNPNIELVYKYQQQLSDIWHKTCKNQKELVEALQDWCHRAEQSGVQALQDFANYIRQYGLMKAPAKV